MRLNLPVSIAVASIISLVGCSSNDSGASSAATTPTSATVTPDTVPATTSTLATTTTSTSTTTTTLDPLTLSQGAYFLITSDSNGALYDLAEKYQSADGILWSDMPAYCAESIVIDERLIAQLSEAEWIPEAQEAVDELIAANLALLTYWYQCARAPGTFDAQAPIDELVIEAGNRTAEAATAVRFALGLPIDR
jgi:hypothetical protein